jgi:lipopolysaccharide export system permease protein
MPRKTNSARHWLAFLSPLKRWLGGHPRAVSILALLATAGACTHLLLRCLPVYWGDPLGNIESGQAGITIFKFIRESYFFGMWLLLPVLLLALARARRDGPPFAAAAVGSAVMFAVWVASEIVQHGASKLELAGVEPSPMNALFRLALTGGLIISPPFLVWIYSRAPLLSRYVLCQFLSPFAYCFIGFIAIWLVIDLSDNGPDFFEIGAPIAGVARVYMAQMPLIVVLILPITLLLALLYSLGKMSKSNEIISMLTAGKSLPKVLLPLFFVGFYASLITLALNYEWAPEADERKDSILASFEDDSETAKNKRRFSVRARLYRNREDRRTWFVGRIPFDIATEKLRDIEIYEGDLQGRTKVAYFAAKAGWNYTNREWRLISGRKIFFDDEGNVTHQHKFDTELIPGWRETPWKIYSESLDPEALGVPGLAFHIKTNADQPAKLLAPFRTHWHYRWALPWSCFVITLIAAPLGIVFSRRGMMGGVAAAILIFFGMMVFNNLLLALGQGMHVPAFLGAWATNLVVAAIGLLLLRFRSNNRELPKPSLAGAWKWVTGLASKNGRRPRNRGTTSA